MKKDGIVLPIPRKECSVEISETQSCGISFSISVQENEFITLADAARLLCLSKARAESLINQRGIAKHNATEHGYLLLKSDIEKVRHGFN